MIRQELMDNIKEIKNKLEVAIDIKDRGIDRLETIKEAYLITVNLETMVAEELEAQRQEQSELILDAYFTEEHEFDEFKEYCAANNLKPSNGKVLNEYFKERGV